MTMPPDASRIVAEWLSRAEDDLRSAEHLLTMGADCPFRNVCFFCQQSVEKHLKALLVQVGVEFPKTHDIAKLVRLLPAVSATPLSAAEQERLTDYAFTARYPGDEEPLTADDAREAVAVARRVRNAVRERLSGKTPESRP
ncbi:MAG: HEPN domain-containing protein [Candidatus Eisenbacteria bacterium]